MRLTRVPFALLLLTAAIMTAQREARPGTVQRVPVHAKSLEGNLEGDSADRDVAVYLPPGYNSSGVRRYPVVYLLHGFTDDVDHWWGVKPHFISVPAVADKAIAAGVGEMIVVMPNAFTRYEGSMYSNSPTTGNWEEFLTSELVSYIDSHYRTIASPAGRGLAGHSMGGYGTIRIGMKYPGVFSSLYLMSPCCLEAGGTTPSARAEAIRDPSEVTKADFMTKAMLASAAAWSPNPKKPPLFLDLPFENGQLKPAILAKWHANAPLSMLDQYTGNLRRYKAIGLDVGKDDRFIAVQVEALHQALDTHGIRHVYQVYDGNHINRVAQQLETKVFPFFSEQFR